MIPNLPILWKNLRFISNWRVFSAQYTTSADSKRSPRCLLPFVRVIDVKEKLGGPKPGVEGRIKTLVGGAEKIEVGKWGSYCAVSERGTEKRTESWQWQQDEAELK